MLTGPIGDVGVSCVPETRLEVPAEEWPSVSDCDPDAAVATRRRVLATLANTDVLLIGTNSRRRRPGTFGIATAPGRGVGALAREQAPRV